MAPILAVALAIAVSSAMDATGLTLYSALVLFPLLVICCLVWRRSAASMGLRAGRPRDYVWAAIYPIAVIGAGVGIAVLAGSTDTSHAHWQKAAINFALFLAQGIPVGLLTEEGFFRGWLWSSFEKAGVTGIRVVWWTSIAFALWHVSLVVLDKSFRLPPLEAMVYVANISVIGLIWGLMRWRSGSIVVTSASHALWNAGAYVLYGIGTFAGVLGIANSAAFGAETGIVGLSLNVLFAAVFWWFVSREVRGTTA